jgi:hypothetical protein
MIPAGQVPGVSPDQTSTTSPRNVMNVIITFGQQFSLKTAMFGLLLASVFLSGCASTTITDPAKRADLGMPSPGKSKVVFIRPGKFEGGGIHFGVHDEERLIGKLLSSTYFVYECDPGHHVFSTSMENLSFLDANLLPDRIYYVKVEATMGLLIARAKMSALYPGCDDIPWQKMPGLLAESSKTTITSEEVERDMKGAEGYTERLKKNENEPEPHKDANKILPEYGQTAPIFSQ